MEISIVICGDNFTKEELRHLLQGVRDEEQRSFPEKEIFMAVYTPQLTTTELAEILGSLKPPFKQGPLIVGEKISPH